MRWIAPVFFFAATGWVAWYNDQHDDRKIVFPFVDAIFPEAHGDPAQMGEKSVMLLFALSCVVLGFAVIGQVRAFARRRELED